MEQKDKDKVYDLIQNVEQYMDTQKELIKLQAIEKASLAASALASNMIVLSIFLLMFLFFSVALAYFLSDLFGKMFTGFAAVGIIYLLIGIILYSKKESILQTPITNNIIKNFLKMTKIKNIEDLRAEISRLEGVSKQQKEVVKRDIIELKDSFKLSTLLTDLISDITGINIDKKGFLKDGFAYTISLLIQQFILKSERKFEKNIYNIVDSVFEKVKHFISSFANPEAKRREPGVGLRLEISL